MEEEEEPIGVVFEDSDEEDDPRQIIDTKRRNDLLRKEEDENATRVRCVREAFYYTVHALFTRTAAHVIKERFVHLVN